MFLLGLRSQEAPMLQDNRIYRLLIVCVKEF